MNGKPFHLKGISWFGFELQQGMLLGLEQRPLDDVLHDRTGSMAAFGYDDDATTANTQIAFYDFKPVPLIFVCPAGSLALSNQPLHPDALTRAGERRR